MAPCKTGRPKASTQGWFWLAPHAWSWEPRYALKSPFLNSVVGVVSRKFDAALCTRKPLYQPKKNVLSLRIGPPAVAPNSFCLLRGVLEAKNPRASNPSLRKYSYTEPCNWLVPDFKVKLVKHAPDGP